MKLENKDKCIADEITSPTSLDILLGYGLFEDHKRLSCELVRSSHATGREHIEMKFVIVWIDMSIGENGRSKIN